MAKQQLTSLAAKLILDTRQFEDGTTASRKELNTIRKAMQDTETPLEKYERKMADLGDVLKKDSRFQETYNRKAEQFAEELKKAERQLDGFNDELKEGGKSGANFAEMITATGAALEIAEKAFGAMGTAIDRISNLNTEIRELEKYGIAAAHFGTFKILASDAGLAVEDVADATKNLTIRLGEATAEPEGGIAKVFEKLGLSAEKLAKQNPEQQLAAFSKAIQDVPDYTNKLQIVDELLSDSGTKILDTILMKSDAIRDAASRADQLGIGISEEDRIEIEKAAAASKEMGLAWEAFTNKIAIALGPLLTDVLEATTKVLDFVSGGTQQREAEASAARMEGGQKLNLMRNIQAGVGAGTMTVAQAKTKADDFGVTLTPFFLETLQKQTEVLEGIKNNQETNAPIGANIGT